MWRVARRISTHRSLTTDLQVTAPGELPATLTEDDQDLGSLIICLPYVQDVCKEQGWWLPRNAVRSCMRQRCACVRWTVGLDLDSHLRTLCVHGVAHLLGCVGLLLAATICRAVRCDDPW